MALNERHRPSVMALSRQKLKPCRLRKAAENRSARGAYVIAGEEDGGAAVIFASGSEVEIAIATRSLLEADGISTRVVSVPSMELFARQPAEYRAKLLGKERVRGAIEAGIRMGWDAFIGTDGEFVGMTGYGASGPMTRSMHISGSPPRPPPPGSKQGSRLARMARFETIDAIDWQNKRHCSGSISMCRWRTARCATPPGSSGLSRLSGSSWKGRGRLILSHFDRPKEGLWRRCRQAACPGACRCARRRCAVHRHRLARRGGARGGRGGKARRCHPVREHLHPGEESNDPAFARGRDARRCLCE